MKSLTLLSLICLVLNIACSKKYPCGDEWHDYGCSKNNYKPNQNLTLFDNKELSIVLIDVEDKRCPCDVVCEIPGYAKVSLLISNADESEEIAMMITPYGYKNPEMTELMGYLITLVNVCPYPSITTQEDLKLSDFTVDLEVEKI